MRTHKIDRLEQSQYQLCYSYLFLDERNILYSDIANLAHLTTGHLFIFKSVLKRDLLRQKLNSSTDHIF